MGCLQSKQKKEITAVSKDEGKKAEKTDIVESTEAPVEAAVAAVAAENTEAENTAAENTEAENTEANKEDSPEEVKVEEVAITEEIKEESAITEEKVIVVFGATGTQGGSVARALLQDPQYKVKAVTRDPDSDKAKLLAKEGAEVIKADLDEPESLKSALEGAYGVFLVTNYWEEINKEKDTKQGKDTADACKEAGIKHLVYSGSEICEKVFGTEVPHFDSKGVVEEYIQEQGLPFTVVRYSFYYENMLTFFKPSKGDDGNYTINVPMGDTALDMVYAGAAGECVHQIFNNLEDNNGKMIGLASDVKTISEIAEIYSKQIEDKTFVAGEMTTEQFGEQGWPGCNQLAAMFDFYQSGKCERSVEDTKKLHPDIPDFSSWVEDNKDAIVASLD